MRRVLHVAITVATCCSAAPLVAPRRPSEASSHRLPLLRALRGGALPEPLLWVRAPPSTSGGDDDDDGGDAKEAAPLQMVRSLSAFCKEHDLDEEAMLAVSRGEREDVDGWTCGKAVEYDVPSKTAAAAKKAKKEPVKAAEDEDEEEEATVVDVKADKVETAEAMDDDDDDDTAAAKPPSPAVSAFNRNKMLIGLVAPMAVLQLLKMYDQTKPEFLVYLRGAFFGLIALNTLVQLLLDWRIASTNDTTPVKAPMDPLSMLMGGLGGGGPKPQQTAAEYDKAQLNSLRNSYRLGCMFTCFLHFKMKMTQPLVYNSVSGVIDLVFNPLVNIHLLGKKAEGPFKRPFGAAEGPQGNPLAAMLGGAPPAAAAEGAADAK